jgi:hypothetical protein
MAYISIGGFQGDPGGSPGNLWTLFPEVAVHLFMTSPNKLLYPIALHIPDVEMGVLTARNI